MPDVPNVGVPATFSGARARFFLNNEPVAYSSGVSGEETINDFAKASHKYIEGLKAKFPDVKKVMDSQDKFKEDFAEWRAVRGGVAPWPHEMFIKGQHMQ